MRKHCAVVSSINIDNLTLEDVKGKKAYCCVSLSNPNYYGKRLAAIFDFLDSHFDKVMIITGGYLYRLNYQLLYNLDEMAATRTALQEEESYIKNELTKFNHLLSGRKFDLLTWSDYAFNDDYQTSLQEVTKFYDTNKEFKKDIIQAAESFINSSRLLKNKNNADHKSNIQYSIRFLLEEAAMFNLLISYGYDVEVYPGRMVTVLNDIVAGKYDSSPVNLTKRISIELMIKRQGRKRAWEQKIKETHIS